MTEENKNEISWKCSEYAYFPKSRQWLIATGVLGVVILLFSLWMRDYIMFITLFIVFFVGYLYAVRSPRTITVTLDGQGVVLSRTAYPYNTLKSFWIHFEPPHLKTLNFQTGNYLNRDLVIQLDDQDPNEVRTFLLRYLPEEIHREEPYSDKLLRKFKF